MDINMNTIIKIMVVVVLLAGAILLGTLAFQRYVKTRIEIAKAKSEVVGGLIGNTIGKII